MQLPGSGPALIQADGCPLVINWDGNLYYAKGNLEIMRIAPDGKQSLLVSNLKETTEKLGGIKGLASCLRACGCRACGAWRWTSTATFTLRPPACGCVVKITPEGQVSTVLKAEPPWSPTGIAVGKEGVYVLEYPNSDVRADWRPRVRLIQRNGAVRTLATIERFPR